MNDEMQPATHSILDTFAAVKKPRLDISPGLLPLQIPQIITTPTDCPELFNISMTAWSLAFDHKHTGEVLNNLVSGGTNVQVQLQIDELNALRKYGLIVKSAWILFDQSHLAPPLHHKFIKVLGEVKDARFDPVHLPKAAKRVLEELKKYPIVPTALPFTPATSDSFNAKYAAILDSIRIALQSDDTLAVEFHGLRKNSRHLMNLFQIASVRRMSPELISIFQVLSDVNQKLGKEHDIIVQKALHGEVNYDTQIMEIDASVRNILAAFLAKHK